MAALDVFNNSVFNTTSMTGFVNRTPYIPQTIGGMNLFQISPVRTRNIFVERKNGTLNLVPTTQVGESPTQRDADKRDATAFRVPRLAVGSRITAEEVQGIRADVSESELKQVGMEVNDRMARLVNDIELTHEYHRLGALNGLVLDADGTTVVEDFYDKFNIARPAAINFALTAADTEVSNVIKNMTRSMARSSRGAFVQGTEVHALCGHNFYDLLTSHPQVEKFYLNWQGSQALRADSGAYGVFFFEGVYWHDYRGTDDNSTVAIPEDGVRFFPVKGQDVFVKAQAPAEFGPYVNTRGQDKYALIIPDTKRQAHVDVELYSYPLYMCQRPEVLRSGVAS